MKKQVKDKLRRNIFNTIKDLKAEIKDNKAEIKVCIKNRYYGQAAHLESVNNCLDYVVDILLANLHE